MVNSFFKSYIKIVLLRKKCTKKSTLNYLDKQNSAFFLRIAFLTQYICIESNILKFKQILCTKCTTFKCKLTFIQFSNYHSLPYTLSVQNCVTYISTHTMTCWWVTEGSTQEAPMCASWMLPRKLAEMVWFSN